MSDIMYDKVAYVIMRPDKEGEWKRYFSCYTLKGITNYANEYKESFAPDGLYRIEVWDRGVLELCQLCNEMYGHHYN